VAGSATSTGFAGHAGATASAKLTFDLDHSMWAAQSVTSENNNYCAVAKYRPADTTASNLRSLKIISNSNIGSYSRA